MKTFRIPLCVATTVVAAVCTLSNVHAELAEYYIGVDSRTTPFQAPSADGGGDYPDNPNFNRLTLLYQHGDHFHGIGQHIYAGPAASPTPVDTNGNNRLPETNTLQPPLPLVPGTGVYAGKNTSAHIPGVEYSDLEMQNIQSLNGAGSAEDVLLNSSSGRWAGSFGPAHIHLELVGVSSPLLNVGTPSDPLALSVGGNVHVGDGDEMFSFTPVLWVDETAPAGHYWAEFRLVDESGTFGDSGRFYFDVQQVPEPSTVGLIAVAMVGLLRLRRRNASYV